MIRYAFTMILLVVGLSRAEDNPSSDIPIDCQKVGPSISAGPVSAARQTIQCIKAVGNQIENFGGQSSSNNSNSSPNTQDTSSR
jgi:hypothetical protein